MNSEASYNEARVNSRLEKKRTFHFKWRFVQMLLGPDRFQAWMVIPPLARGVRERG